ncbi:hypothetical protein SNEBB_007128 [Seison nebaliae]|nr:hypothetical protein SNEBB_007128 [Seison nebaliae]
MTTGKEITYLEFDTYVYGQVATECLDFLNFKLNLQTSVECITKGGIINTEFRRECGISKCPIIRSKKEIVVQYYCNTARPPLCRYQRHSTINELFNLDYGRFPDARAKPLPVIRKSVLIMADRRKHVIDVPLLVMAIFTLLFAAIICTVLVRDSKHPSNFEATSTDSR